MNEPKRKLTKELLDELGSWGNSTPGTALVARFCNAVSNNKTPSQKDMETIAHALEPLRWVTCKDKTKTDNYLRDQLDEFARRMELKRKRGRIKKTWQDEQKEVAAVVLFLQKQEEFQQLGYKQKDAKTQAVKEVAKINNVGDRSVNNWIKKHYRRAYYAKLFMEETQV